MMRDQLENALRLGGLEADILQLEEDAFALVRVMKALEGTHSVPAGPSLAEIAADVKEIMDMMKGKTQ